ncbi:hypothetical protein M2405_006169 [Rhodococcus erythropolis]|nr:hypothetical protein [Rhodococcus erythropolis]MCW2425146.1 hypothetical protein [Rhodococcus erythropolis]
MPIGSFLDPAAKTHKRAVEVNVHRRIDQS